MYVFVVVVVVDVVCNGSSLVERFEVPYHQSLFYFTVAHSLEKPQRGVGCEEHKFSQPSKKASCVSVKTSCI